MFQRHLFVKLIRVHLIEIGKIPMRRSTFTSSRNISNDSEKSKILFRRFSAFSLQELYKYLSC